MFVWAKFVQSRRAVRVTDPLAHARQQQCLRQPATRRATFLQQRRARSLLVKRMMVSDQCGYGLSNKPTQSALAGTFTGEELQAHGQAWSRGGALTAIHVPEATHWVHHENPGLVSKLLCDFVAAR